MEKVVHIHIIHAFVLYVNKILRHAGKKADGLALRGICRRDGHKAADVKGRQHSDLLEQFRECLRQNAGFVFLSANVDLQQDVLLLRRFDRLA